MKNKCTDQQDHEGHSRVHERSRNNIRETANSKSERDERRNKEMGHQEVEKGDGRKNQPDAL